MFLMILTFLVIALLQFAMIGVVKVAGPPDQIIGDATDPPYLRRWIFLPRNRFGNIFIHHFLRSDDPRALHDHPWPNVSIILSGDYIEYRNGKSPVHRSPGCIVFRRAAAAHRIELIGAAPVWSLFLVGPRVREWGFWCPQGWRHWRDYTDGASGQNVGRGCD